MVDALRKVNKGCTYRFESCLDYKILPNHRSVSRMAHGWLTTWKDK